jgi:hypothetical protein
MHSRGRVTFTSDSQAENVWLQPAPATNGIKIGMETIALFTETADYSMISPDRFRAQSVTGRVAEWQTRVA